MLTTCSFVAYLSRNDLFVEQPTAGKRSAGKQGGSRVVNKSSRFLKPHCQLMAVGFLFWRVQNWGTEVNWIEK
jgi:hypothetical protein